MLFQLEGQKQRRLKQEIDEEGALGSEIREEGSKIGAVWQRCSRQDFHHNAIQRASIQKGARAYAGRCLPIEKNQIKERRLTSAQHLGYCRRLAIQINHATLLQGCRDRIVGVRLNRSIVFQRH